MGRLALSLLVSFCCAGTAIADSGENVRFTLQTDESYTLACDPAGRPLDHVLSTTVAEIDRPQGTTADPSPAGILSGAVTVNGAVLTSGDLKCPIGRCVAVPFLVPACSTPPANCRHLHKYQVHVNVQAVDGSKVDCDMRVDVEDVHFVP